MNDEQAKSVLAANEEAARRAGMVYCPRRGWMAPDVVITEGVRKRRGAERHTSHGKTHGTNAYGQPIYDF